MTSKERIQLVNKDSHNLSDSFFRKVGSAHDFFDNDVRETLTRYSEHPEEFSSVEELLILAKYNLALSVERPGIADADGVYKIADAFRSIAHDGNFSYRSEMAHKFAEYIDASDSIAYFYDDADGLKPLVNYDKQRGWIKQDAYHGDFAELIYAQVSDDIDDDRQAESFKDLLNTPKFQSFFAREVGFSTEEFGTRVPLKQLVNYMMSRPPADYEKDTAIFAKIDSAMKPMVAEAFLATEFGDDLGEQILEFAEAHANGSMETLGSVAEILTQVRRFTGDGIIGGVSPELADDIRRGISTRVSELLFTLNQRHERGKPTEAPERALRKLLEWSQGVARMLEGGVPEKVQQTGDTWLYHFRNPKTNQKYPGSLELTAFGKFTEDATPRERYVKEGRGARISINYDEENSNYALSLNGVMRRNSMNGRFDKSVYQARTGESVPDAEWAEVSFDIASTHSAKDSDSYNIAAMISEASAIRNTGNGRKGGSGNYTYDIIDQKHGQRDKFASYIHKMVDILDEKTMQRQTRKIAQGATAHSLGELWRHI